jgi:hypothetical protein
MSGDNWVAPVDSATWAMIFWIQSRGTSKRGVDGRCEQPLKPAHAPLKPCVKSIRLEALNSKPFPKQRGGVRIAVIEFEGFTGKQIQAG